MALVWAMATLQYNQVEYKQELAGASSFQTYHTLTKLVPKNKKQKQKTNRGNWLPLRTKEPSLRNNKGKEKAVGRNGSLFLRIEAASTVIRSSSAPSRQPLECGRCLLSLKSWEVPGIPDPCGSGSAER